TPSWPWRSTCSSSKASSATPTSAAPSDIDWTSRLAWRSIDCSRCCWPRCRGEVPSLTLPVVIGCESAHEQITTRSVSEGVLRATAISDHIPLKRQRGSRTTGCLAPSLVCRTRKRSLAYASGCDLNRGASVKVDVVRNNVESCYYFFTSARP